jgi:hypothetical protein
MRGHEQQTFNWCIWGSHGCDCLDVACFGESPTSRTNPSSTVKVEALCSFEMSGVSRLTRRYNPDDRTLNMLNS